ncbi:LmeA family phospholipid-binding protein [Mycobacterium sp. MYCO198283]|uniref:LmeA family phospholipid-binding protein n=1 Tax=Mycobacterium sp. MYCO198283 TaxID=2883505 RepID=UPI001E2B0F42|nr:DUF2993 domain-containing protein [Mycobacterium sp. MYCO198283]MCG5432293.1 LmeA family phospholipid-binding protein [Mycobacterium sp. MYCO198283]
MTTPQGPDDATAWGRPAPDAPRPLPPQDPSAAPADHPAGGAAPSSRRRRFTPKDPLSWVLIAVIVMALVLAGLVGAELYARNRADDVVARVVSCVAKDDATVSFGATPFLWQHLTKHYDGISIETAGNRLRDAEGMKLDLRLDDVEVADTADSGGTVGSVDATITWTTTGIQQTVASSIPFIGGAAVSGVTTNPDDGTLTLQGVVGTVTARPQVVNNAVSLEVLNVTGLGFSLPRESLQPFVDAFTEQIAQSLPLGITPQTIEVTSDGVVSQFASRDAKLPKSQEDPCFAGI